MNLMVHYLLRSFCVMQYWLGMKDSSFGLIQRIQENGLSIFIWHNRKIFISISYMMASYSTHEVYKGVGGQASCDLWLPCWTLGTLKRSWRDEGGQFDGLEASNLPNCSPLMPYSESLFYGWVYLAMISCWNCIDQTASTEWSGAESMS